MQNSQRVKEMPCTHLDVLYDGIDSNSVSLSDRALCVKARALHPRLQESYRKADGDMRVPSIFREYIAKGSHSEEGVFRYSEPKPVWRADDLYRAIDTLDLIASSHVEISKRDVVINSVKYR
jgi:hypothetical protein